MGALHFLWLCGWCAGRPPFEQVGPAHVFEAASDGEHGVGSRFQPVAPGSFEPVPDDVFEGAFHDAGSDRQAARPRGRSKFGPCWPRSSRCRPQRLQTGRGTAVFCNFDQECQDLVSGSMPLGRSRRLKFVFPHFGSGHGPAYWPISAARKASTRTSPDCQFRELWSDTP